MPTTTSKGRSTMQTIADFRQAATAGSRWMCLNRLHPEASGLRTVTGGSTALTFTGQRCGDLSTFTDGRLDIPKPTEVRIDGDRLHALYEPGSPGPGRYCRSTLATTR
jgi:hypothetical protein